MPAPTRAGASAAALTGNGTTASLDITAGHRADAYISHTNGTGTITAGGRVQIQVQRGTSGGFFNWGPPIIFGTTASAVETETVPLPDSAIAVQAVYTVPTGSTGHSMTLSVGTAAY